MTRELHHYMDGKLVKGKSGRFGDVYNPATGEVSKRVPLASADETKKAIAAAEKALPEWSATPPAKRAQVIFRFRELLLENIDELAELLSSEHGKTVPDAKGSVTRGLEVVEFACGIPHLLKGSIRKAWRPVSIPLPCASRSASAPGSRLSTFRPWCPCRCSRWRWPAAMIGF